MIGSFFGGGKINITKELLTQIFGKHLMESQKLINSHKNIDVHYVDYNKLLTCDTVIIKDIISSLSLNIKPET